MSSSSADIGNDSVYGVAMKYLNPNAVAGFLAGSVSSTVLYPLEVVKTRFQIGSHAQFRYTGSLQALSAIYRTRGIRELYRGFPAGFVGSSLSWGMYFWLYGDVKEWLASTRGLPQAGSVEHWTASVLSSIAVQTLLCPLWVVKLNQQLGQYDSFWSGARQLVRTDGVRGLYRGLLPGYWSSAHLALQFVLYEEFKRWDIFGFLAVNTVFATVSSKSLATIATSPIEVLKVRLRSSNVDISHTARSIGSEIWRKEGVRGFYKGVGTALLRILPGQCLMFVTYETVKVLLTRTS